MPASQPDDLDPSRKVSPWIKAFVAFHLVAITVYAMPNPPQDLMDGKRPAYGTEPLLVWNKNYLKSIQPITCYLYMTGFWQYWDMFSPDPSQIDFWFDAMVKYKDGSVKHYQYPRMYLLPIPLKFVEERFRKFYERVNGDDANQLWPIVAQRIAHEMDNPSNPPVEVRLTRHWLKIEPPGKVQPTDYNHYEFFVYAVDPKRLEWARSHF